MLSPVGLSPRSLAKKGQRNKNVDLPKGKKGLWGLYYWKLFWIDFWCLYIYIYCLWPYLFRSTKLNWVSSCIVHSIESLSSTKTATTAGKKHWVQPGKVSWESMWGIKLQHMTKPSGKKNGVAGNPGLRWQHIPRNHCLGCPFCSWHLLTLEKRKYTRRFEEFFFDRASNFRIS